MIVSAAKPWRTALRRDRRFPAFGYRAGAFEGVTAVSLNLPKRAHTRAFLNWLRSVNPAWLPRIALGIDHAPDSIPFAAVPAWLVGEGRSFEP